ncbi:hypothetical protein M5S18_12435, partial [Avibacterium paragallinarum]
KSGKNFFENGPLLWLKIRKKSPAFESWGFLFWENFDGWTAKKFFQNFMYPKGVPSRTKFYFVFMCS